MAKIQFNVYMDRTLVAKLQDVIGDSTKRATKITASRIQRKGRNMIQRTMPGKMANQWNVIAYPKGRTKSLDTAISARQRARYSMIFEEGGQITAKGGGLLWLPLPPAVALGGKKRITPSQMAFRLGAKLVPIYGGKRPLLAARFATRKNGTLATTKRNRAAQSGKKKAQLVPLFFGIQSVTIAPRWHLLALCATEWADMAARVKQGLIR